MDLRALARHVGTHRDMAADAVSILAQASGQRVDVVLQFQGAEHTVELAAALWVGTAQDRGVGHVDVRSEEHTSELQSQSNLVCRLLLEKKKKKEVEIMVEMSNR